MMEPRLPQCGTNSSSNLTLISFPLTSPAGWFLTLLFVGFRLFRRLR